MKHSVWWAAACAALPALAQDRVPQAAGCAEETAPAHAALPARAATTPQPQLGTVAPSTRVPSHVETPSARAMRRALARNQGQDADAEPVKTAGVADCRAVKPSEAPPPGNKK